MESRDLVAKDCILGSVLEPDLTKVTQVKSVKHKSKKQTEAQATIPGFQKRSPYPVLYCISSCQFLYCIWTSSRHNQYFVHSHKGSLVWLPMTKKFPSKLLSKNAVQKMSLLLGYKLYVWKTILDSSESLIFNLFITKPTCCSQQNTGLGSQRPAFKSRQSVQSKCYPLAVPHSVHPPVEVNKMMGIAQPQLVCKLAIKNPSLPLAYRYSVEQRTGLNF